MSLVDEDRFRRALLDYYNQRGGNYPIFRGAVNQYGLGIGDFFRSAIKFLLPIFTPVATKFISSTASSLSEGQSLKDSAKGALAPTFGEALNATGSQIMNRMGGRGRKRKAKPKKTQSKKAMMVYKGPTPTRKQNKSTNNLKLPRFLASNF